MYWNLLIRASKFCPNKGSPFDPYILNLKCEYSVSANFASLYCQLFVVSNMLVH